VLDPRLGQDSARLKLPVSLPDDYEAACLAVASSACGDGPGPHDWTVRPVAGINWKADLIQGAGVMSTFRAATFLTGEKCLFKRGATHGLPSQPTR
jgi:hypothetical protein